MDVSIPCSHCGAPVRTGDDFCQRCGGAISTDLKAALSQRLEASDFETAKHLGHVRQARGAIATLAVLYVIGGLFAFYLAFQTAQQALSNLDGLAASSIVPQAIDGVTYTAGELRRMVEREPYQVLGLNLLLAAIMFGLFLWAKRAPLPAVMTALAVFATVQVGNALIDPKTIIQGVVIKIIAIVLLIRGVRSALAARAIERSIAARPA
jgi:hypothetical protein